MKTEVLLNDLIQRTQDIMNTLNVLENQPLNVLQWKPDQTSWSVLECLEHLNLYGDFYLPEIRKRMSQFQGTPASDEFKTGLLGNYFAKMMLPREKINRMKTFKDKNPSGSSLDYSTLDKFRNQQMQILELLESARSLDLNRIKTSISISSLIKLKLGDTLRVLIYHNQRHLAQANKVLETQQSTNH
jgi:hypothetical protein